MISYQRRLKDRIGWRLQVNVENVQNRDELLITDKDNTGTYRYVFQTPRRWALTSTFDF